MLDYYGDEPVRNYDSELTARDEDKPVSLLEESMMACDSLLQDQQDLLTRLEKRLRPVINDKDMRNPDNGNQTKTVAGGLFSPITNRIMHHSDSISVANARIRQLLDTLEV
jgi:hypothetical protein